MLLTLAPLAGASTVEVVIYGISICKRQIRVSESQFQNRRAISPAIHAAESGRPLLRATDTRSPPQIGSSDSKNLLELAGVVVFYHKDPSVFVQKVAHFLVDGQGSQAHIAGLDALRAQQITRLFDGRMIRTEAHDANLCALAADR